jgi:hypothetical protein
VQLQRIIAEIYDLAFEFDGLDDALFYPEALELFNEALHTHDVFLFNRQQLKNRGEMFLFA